MLDVVLASSTLDMAVPQHPTSQQSLVSRTVVRLWLDAKSEIEADSDTVEGDDGMAQVLARMWSRQVRQLRASAVGADPRCCRYSSFCKFDKPGNIAVLVLGVCGGLHDACNNPGKTWILSLKIRLTLKLR